MPRSNGSIDFQRVIAALLDGEHPFPLAYLRQFSDMEPADFDRLKEAWGGVGAERRLELMRMLLQVAESDTLVCFDDLSRFALNDSDPRVRAQAVGLLWECEDFHLAPPFIGLMLHDPDSLVRAVAATALGNFEYLGELEEIPQEVHRNVEESLLEVARGTDLPGIRRRALESLGYSGRKEVPPLIRSAFESGDAGWMSSALMAMGRSLDTRWESEVLLSMRSQLPEVSLEAIRAAGLIELASARQPLLELLEDPDQMTGEMREAVIWSLSQIGGEDVSAALEYLLENSTDEEEIDFIGAALDNLEFTEGFPELRLLDYDPETLLDLDLLGDDEEESDAGEAGSAEDDQ